MGQKIRINQDKIKSILKNEEPDLKIYQSTTNFKPEKNGEKITVNGVEYDVYEYNEQKYIIKNGIKVDVRFYEDLGNKIPLYCPKCNKLMKHKFDSKHITLHNMCYECYINYETDLQIEGTYAQYEENKLLQNKLAYAKDMIQLIDNTLQNELKRKYEYVGNSDGHVETWENTEYDNQYNLLVREKNILVQVVELIEKLLNKEITGEEYDEKIKSVK